MRPRGLTFLGNERILFFADQPFTYGSLKTFTVQAVVTDLEGRTFERPFAAHGARADTAREAERFGFNFAVLLEGTLQDANKYIVARQNLQLGTAEVLALDARTLAVERVARAGDDQEYLLADLRDGQLMVRQSVVFENGAWQLVREVRNRATDAWERHPELSFPVRERWTIDPLGFFEADPNLLYVSTNRGENFASVRIYDTAARRWRPEPAFSSAEYDIIGVTASGDRETRQLNGAGSYTIAGPAYRQAFVDDYWAPIQRTLEAQFRGRQVEFIARNKRLGRALIEVSAANYAPEYYMLMDGRELRLLGRSHPWIDNAMLGETSFVRFQARDGLTIPAFLTLPPGYDENVHGRIPVVVLPHGGPWSRDTLGWDASYWTQFLATRGYAVIQPQFRGSSGWGMALWKAGDRQWGLKMSDDNDDAAAYLVAEGVGDPQRMAIFGYSYGGFAAIAASVRPNSPYRCALSGAGVSDIDRLELLWGANRVAREYQGWTVEGLNPIDHVREANIPILLYHGDHDRQADTVHSREFHGAMRGAGKTVEYHEIRTMWHQIPWWPEWQRESLGYIERWLAGPNCFGSRE
jgi:dipeptidyl aminopeptidase/acylaminoacyl peptidase